MFGSLGSVASNNMRLTENLTVLGVDDLRGLQSTCTPAKSATAAGRISLLGRELRYLLFERVVELGQDCEKQRLFMTEMVRVVRQGCCRVRRGSAESACRVSVDE